MSTVDRLPDVFEINGLVVDVRGLLRVGQKMKSLLKLLFQRSRPPVSRLGRDRARILLGTKEVTLQGEMLRDDDGYSLWVAVPVTSFWDKPAGEPITARERQAIIALINDKTQWQPGERFEF